MLPLGSQDVLHRALGMLTPLFSGSLKCAERRALNLAVSSRAGSLQMGASLLAFFMEMKISFSCISGDGAGFGGVRQLDGTETRAADA